MTVNYGISPLSFPLSESDIAAMKVVCIARVMLVDRAENTMCHLQMFERVSCRVRAISGELR